VETIEALGETIVPGARAAGIAHFIDQQLSVPLEEALLETRSPATITSAKAMTPAIDEPQLERDPHLPLHYFDRRRSRLQRSGSHKTRRWRKTDSNLWSHFQRGQRFRTRHSVSRSTAPATSVLISENDDFEFPPAKVTSLAKARASC